LSIRMMKDDDILVAADVDAEGEDGQEKDHHDQAQDPDQGPVDVGVAARGIQGPGKHTFRKSAKEFWVCTNFEGFDHDQAQDPDQGPVDVGVAARGIQGPGQHTFRKSAREFLFCTNFEGFYHDQAQDQDQGLVGIAVASGIQGPFRETEHGPHLRMPNSGVHPPHYIKVGESLAKPGVWRPEIWAQQGKS
jgi:hypothetical protein